MNEDCSELGYGPVASNSSIKSREKKAPQYPTAHRAVSRADCGHSSKSGSWHKRRKEKSLNRDGFSRGQQPLLFSHDGDKNLSSPVRDGWAVTDLTLSTSMVVKEIAIPSPPPCGQFQSSFRSAGSRDQKASWETGRHSGAAFSCSSVEGFVQPLGRDSLW